MGKPIPVVIVVLAGVGGVGRCWAEDPFPGRIPGVNISWNLPGDFEPSGALWHHGLNRLLIVHDNGAIAAVNRGGGDVRVWRCPGDVEAITAIDTQDTVVFVGIERPDAIKAFDLDAEAFVGSWDLTPWMRGEENRGLEALTFVPDEHLPIFPQYNLGRGSRYGTPGFFYAGLEADGRIYVFDIDLDRDDEVGHVATFTPMPGRVGISGLHFHEPTGLVYALYNSVDRIAVMLPSAVVLYDWEMPRGYVEGITILPSCRGPDGQPGFLFLTDDTGPVWRFDFYEADRDLDDDGVPDCRDRCPATPPRVPVDRHGCRLPGSELDGAIRR